MEISWSSKIILLKGIISKRKNIYSATPRRCRAISGPPIRAGGVSG